MLTRRHLRMADLTSGSTLVFVLFDYARAFGERNRRIRVPTPSKDFKQRLPVFR
jgi:hypothetical protein